MRACVYRGVCWAHASTADPRCGSCELNEVAFFPDVLLLTTSPHTSSAAAYSSVLIDVSLSLVLKTLQY